MSNRVPHGWIVSQINDTCDVFDYMRIPLNTQERALRKGRYPYYGANGVQGYIDDYIFDGEYVLLAEDGGYFDQWSTRPISYLVTGKFWVNNHAHILKAKAGHETKYVHYSLVHKNILEHINGGTRSKLNQSDMRNIEYLTPPLPEQQKIAIILSSVDDVIEKTRAQIDKLKDLKTGMMQELLTKGIGHTEFKDSPVGRIPVEWDVVHLESLVSIMESGWSPQCDSVPAKGCEWAVLKTTAVSWDGFDFTANKKLPDELEPRPKIQVEVHDILITRAGPAERVGVVSYVEHVPRRIMLSDKLIRIKAHHNQNPQFLSFWLSTEFVRNYFSQRTTGLAQSQTNISQDILKSLLCVVPPLAEQETISSTISALEKQLMTKRNILSHYEKMKKALMQDLLAGKVRVKLNESAVQ